MVVEWKGDIRLLYWAALKERCKGIMSDEKASDMRRRGRGPRSGDLDEDARASRLADMVLVCSQVSDEDWWVSHSKADQINSGGGGVKEKKEGSCWVAVVEICGREVALLMSGIGRVDGDRCASAVNWEREGHGIRPDQLVWCT